MKHTIVVGGGFGGLAAAREIRKIPNMQVTLIDRRNFHLFQPLLYQVAMAGLSPTDIAVPLRALFRGIKNVSILLQEIDKLDLTGQRVGSGSDWTAWDYLVLACGAKHSYFGQNQWEELAPGLKTVEQALEIRRRVLLAFELAEKAPTPEERSKCLTFVVVGGGPTGVELAGGIAELARHTLRKDFRRADLRNTRVLLVESGSRVLSAFPEALSDAARSYLNELGVEVIAGQRASELSVDGLLVGNEKISARTILWAAGVFPSSLTAQVPGEKDPQGRVIVSSDLSLPNHPQVFVIGDQAAIRGTDGKFLPGIAPVAIQQGRFLRDVIGADLAKRNRPSFRYLDKGIMATVGRTKAVAHTGGMKFRGLSAWIIWVFVHILYLARFKNRVFVLLHWAWAYFTFGRGARLITHKTWRFYSGEKIDLQ
ncbi:MAG: NAD(P)/FAD-dependent oxidoreductase [Bdellovibrionales bacterium]|nr:NAD(P)/FAD-dependent oxidoreductase [Bdellovibrionales bacterium]